MAPLPVILLAAVIGQSGPFTAPAGQAGDCWIAPLQLSLFELAETGRIAEAVVRDHCLRRVDADAALQPFRAVVVAQTRLADAMLLGERLSFGLDVVMIPGRVGSPDSLYVVPAVDLPQSWQMALDRAINPLVLTGSAVIMAAVIIGMLL